VDDIVESLVRVARLPSSGYRLFNIGSSAPVPLLEFVEELERALGKRAKKRFLPMQPGDVVSTHADIEDLCRLTGYRPSTRLRDGVQKFAAWYLSYTQEQREPAAQALASAR
jgi:UDP-glucuronate 4-epimerase